MEVVRTYTDVGKSGLTIQHRVGCDSLFKMSKVESRSFR
jgi:hypothetical protein